ncbi:MAG: Gfo/Idh/MocA family oxidoreductase [Armatimonadota bacterium]
MTETIAAPQRTHPTMRDVPFARKEIVRVGFAGTGGRANGLLHNLLGVDGTQVVAVQDLTQERTARAIERIEKAGQPAPAVYHGEAGFDQLCAHDDIDLLYIATPWDLHVPMAVAAMESGKAVAVEVPAATTLEGCWQLVETSERTRQHCVLLENCCYGQSEMLVLNLVRAGVFGDLTHAECAYIHDLRSILLADHGEGLWRRQPHIDRDGNLYPTHGLGPVAQYLGIHSGDRFDYLVSVSSRERALTEYRDRTLASDDPRRAESYRCGDMNTSIIKTVRGRTIVLQHDVVSPRPYDRLNSISGTLGAFQDYPPRIYIDGKGGHDWQSIDDYKAEYEHPLWKQLGEIAREKGGHGGMDFLLNYRLIQCFHEGLPPDINVYDTAAWCAPSPLSELSVARGSAPVSFPDFTRGHWE